jgi:hypothetical protein
MGECIGTRKERKDMEYISGLVAFVDKSQISKNYKQNHKIIYKFKRCTVL